MCFSSLPNKGCQPQILKVYSRLDPKALRDLGKNEVEMSEGHWLLRSFLSKSCNVYKYTLPLTTSNCIILAGAAF